MLYLPQAFEQCSQRIKNNIMKSTIKIDYQDRNSGGQPVIKIIQPAQKQDDDAIDFDVRDKLINGFLQTPCMVQRNSWFNLDSCYAIPPEGETKFHVITIAPVHEDNLLYRFRHAILNRFVPEDTIVKLNTRGTEKHCGDSTRKVEQGEIEYFKIHDFFDWLDKTNRPSWEEQHPENKVEIADNNSQKVNDKTVRYFYEMKLSQEARMYAFENTSKIKLENPASSLQDAILQSFYIGDTPQGAVYWQDVILDNSTVNI